MKNIYIRIRERFSAFFVLSLPLSRFSSFFAFKRMAIFNGRLTGNVKLIHTLKSVAPDPEQSWSAFHPLPVHRGTSKLKIMIGQREPSVAFKREL